jgi:Zinc knuckle
MEVLFRQQGGGQGPQDRPGGHEIALAASGNQAPVCWNCGRPGHVSADCQLLSTNNRYRPTPRGAGNGAGGQGGAGGRGGTAGRGAGNANGRS